MKYLKTSKFVSLSILFSEILTGSIVFFIHRIHPMPLRFVNPYIFKGFFYISAAIVLAVLIIKKTMFYSKSFIKLSEEDILRKMASTFMVLNVIAEVISVLGFVLYLLSGSLKYSLTLIAISFVTTILVFPFDYAIKGYMYEIKRKKELYGE